MQRVALEEGVHPHQEAKKDQHRPRHPEEQHRLATEPQLEPDGDEVEYAYGDAADPELRLPRPPRLERDRTLGDPEAFCRGDGYHEAMPIRPSRQAVHHLAAVRL